MPVSSLWVIALDLETFRISQKLFRNKNVVQGPQCIRANFLELKHHSCLYLRKPREAKSACFLLLPHSHCLCSGRRPVLSGKCNSFLFPLIYPLVHCCQSDISTVHIGSCASPVSAVSGLHCLQHQSQAPSPSNLVMEQSGTKLLFQTGLHLSSGLCPD